MSIAQCPMPDAGLDAFVDSLAKRIASFDKQALSDTKRLLDQGLHKAGDVETRLGYYVGQLGNS